MPRAARWSASVLLSKRCLIGDARTTVEQVEPAPPCRSEPFRQQEAVSWSSILNGSRPRFRSSDTLKAFFLTDPRHDPIF